MSILFVCALLWGTADAKTNVSNFYFRVLLTPLVRNLLHPQYTIEGGALRLRSIITVIIIIIIVIIISSASAALRPQYYYCYHHHYHRYHNFISISISIIIIIIITSSFRVNTITFRYAFLLSASLVMHRV